MIPLIMLAIMAGCAAFLFFKGTLLHGIAMVFNAILAGFVAFGFFEILARLLVKYSPGVAVWAPLICFVLLFILVFAILQTAAMQCIKGKTDLGTLPEQIGRPVCGLVLGYLITGHALVAAAMAPMPNQYPYPRFDARNPNPARPAKPILSPDGFVTGLFATVSQGSLSALSAPKSFAVLHAGYVDQLYLNRHKAMEKVPLMTTMTTVSVPKGGVRTAPDSLRDAEGKSISISAGDTLMLIRVDLEPRGLRDAGTFTLSQFRLVCGTRTSGKASLAGQGQAVYPLGYVGDKGRLDRKGLDQIITAASTTGKPVSMDLAFAVAGSLTPLLLEFKRNDVVQVPAPASREEALDLAPFGESQAAPSPQGSDASSGTTSPANGKSGKSGKSSKKGRDRTKERVEGLSGTSLE